MLKTLEIGRGTSKVDVPRGCTHAWLAEILCLAVVTPKEATERHCQSEELFVFCCLPAIFFFFSDLVLRGSAFGNGAHRTRITGPRHKALQQVQDSRFQPPTRAESVLGSVAVSCRRMMTTPPSRALSLYLISRGSLPDGAACPQN